jgi:hypothetical protein
MNGKRGAVFANASLAKMTFGPLVNLVMSRLSNRTGAVTTSVATAPATSSIRLSGGIPLVSGASEVTSRS